jgi:hypothetical protein
VYPGTYNVALVVDGKTIETKPMKVVADPEVQMNDVQRKRYTDMVMELHDLQRRGTQVTEALTSLDSQMTDLAAKVKDSKAPAAVKTQFETLNKEFLSLRPKFGVGAAPGGGGRGGFGGGGGGGGGRGAGGGGAAAGGGAAPAGGGAAAGGAPANAEAAPQDATPGGANAPSENLVARAGTVKGQIMAFNELPSETLTKTYTDVRAALPKAITDANAFLAKAMTMSQSLKKYDLALTVPAPVK